MTKLWVALKHDDYEDYEVGVYTTKQKCFEALAQLDKENTDPDVTFEYEDITIEDLVYLKYDLKLNEPPIEID